MWPFRRKPPIRTVQARTRWQGQVAVIDVRGQTCPGYLLAIDRAVAALPPGTEARLLISYPPCGEDVKAWCREREIAFLGVAPDGDGWVVRISK